MFYGLRGTQLAIAIVVIAGTDFALLGYDQVLRLANGDNRRWATFC